MPGRRRGKSAFTRNRSMLLFQVPAICLFTVVVLAPVLSNTYYAFTDWSGIGREFNFVGFDNFIRMFSDPELLQAIRNTLVFTLVSTPVQIIVALGLALALQRTSAYSSTLRIIILLPITLSGVVIAFVGSLIFDARNGMLAGLADVPVLGVLSQNWLGDPQLAMAAVIAMNTWQWAGLTMLIFIAGLISQPAELHEAARIDGANTWQRLWYVTLPLLAPAITINVVLTVISGLKVFDLIFVFTKGGPAGATQTIVSRVAEQSGFGNFGYSAAGNVTLTIAIIAVSFVLLRLLRRREVAA